MAYVLVINRDPVQREAIATGLDSSGIRSRTADSETESIRLIEEEPPAVVLWEWPATLVPAEIFIALLRQEGFAGSLVICSEELDVQGVPYDALVCKPFELSKLVTTVRRLLPEECGTDGPDGLSAASF